MTPVMWPGKPRHTSSPPVLPIQAIGDLNSNFSFSTALPLTPTVTKVTTKSIQRKVSGTPETTQSLTYFANLFRLYLHTAAYNLLVRLRHEVADPPHEPTSEEVPAEASASAVNVAVGTITVASVTHWAKVSLANWCTRLIKVAARVRETSRRVVVELSASWPYLGHFQEVVQRLLAISTAAPNSS